jgi:hypothetical protein
VRLLDAILCFLRRRDVLDRDELLVGDAHLDSVDGEFVSLVVDTSAVSPIGLSKQAQRYTASDESSVSLVCIGI